jgi:hypothetical protein
MTKLSFGALSPPIHEQLAIDEFRTRPHQRIANAITLLRIQGIITDSETDRARWRLIKRLSEDINEKGNKQ